MSAGNNNLNFVIHAEAKLEALDKLQSDLRNTINLAKATGNASTTGVYQLEQQIADAARESERLKGRLSEISAVDVKLNDTQMLRQCQELEKSLQNQIAKLRAVGGHRQHAVQAPDDGVKQGTGADERHGVRRPAQV